MFSGLWRNGTQVFPVDKCEGEQFHGEGLLGCYSPTVSLLKLHCYGKLSWSHDNQVIFCKKHCCFGCCLPKIYYRWKWKALAACQMCVYILPDPVCENHKEAKLSCMSFSIWPASGWFEERNSSPFKPIGCFNEENMSLPFLVFVFWNQSKNFRLC